MVHPLPGLSMTLFFTWTVVSGVIVGVTVADGPWVAAMVTVGVMVRVNVGEDPGGGLVGVAVMVSVYVNEGVTVMVALGVTELVGVQVTVYVAVKAGVNVAVQTTVDEAVQVIVQVGTGVEVEEHAHVFVNVAVGRTGVFVDVGSTGVSDGVGVAVGVPVAVPQAGPAKTARFESLVAMPAPAMLAWFVTAPHPFTVPHHVREPDWFDTAPRFHFTTGDIEDGAGEAPVYVIFTGIVS